MEILLHWLARQTLLPKIWTDKTAFAKDSFIIFLNFHMLTWHSTMLTCKLELNSLVKRYTERRFRPWQRPNGIQFPRVSTRPVVSPNLRLPNGTGLLFSLIVYLVEALFNVDHAGLENFLTRWFDESSLLTATIKIEITAYVFDGCSVWSSCTNSFGHVLHDMDLVLLLVSLGCYCLLPLLVKPLYQINFLTNVIRWFFLILDKLLLNFGDYLIIFAKLW